MVRFHRYTWFYMLISTLVIGVGMYTLVRYGYRYSIDFTGGTVLVYQTSLEISQNNVTKFTREQGITIKQIESSKKEIYMQTSPLDDAKELQLRSGLEKKYATTIKQLRFETVGPSLGKETTRKTVVAASLAVFGILLYMSFAFKGVHYAIAAIGALIHDFIVLIGMYAIFSHYFGAEFNPLFVTALLTTMSFSVHDTIVIFDKIREYLKGSPHIPPEDLTDRAINETFIRSLNNSLTIIFMLLALLLLGGNTIRFFAAALLVGTITGTYSSPFVATPLLLLLTKLNKKK